MLKKFFEIMLPEIEKTLMGAVNRLDEPANKPFYDMLTYHLGWSGDGAGPEATGKRIRPLLLLLSCAACGADWKNALPAAASIELIHNFSLAHDDIQDSSEMRRGRPSVWKNWGMEQGINVGDALFIMARLTLLDARSSYPPETVLQISEIVDQACLALSVGQFLDISYERRTDLNIEDYWRMVSGKTAALLSACSQIGAILGGADATKQAYYKDFGLYLGKAFQVQDDYLGIWGNSALTGKSTESDLVAGKKSLPVLYGLSKNGPFAKRWEKGTIKAEEVRYISEQLEEDGAKIYTRETADKMTDRALHALHLAGPLGMAGEALFELADNLLRRQA